MAIRPYRSTATSLARASGRLGMPLSRLVTVAISSRSPLHRCPIEVPDLAMVTRQSSTFSDLAFASPEPRLSKSPWEENRGLLNQTCPRAARATRPSWFDRIRAIVAGSACLSFGGSAKSDRAARSRSDFWILSRRSQIVRRRGSCSESLNATRAAAVAVFQSSPTRLRSMAVF